MSFRLWYTIFVQLMYIPIPVNKEEIILAKCFDPGWSGITHQNNNEACKQDQGAERETDLVRKKKLHEKRAGFLPYSKTQQTIAYNTI